jgi:RNA polymerase sigma factor (TIGR02999 family)
MSASSKTAELLVRLHAGDRSAAEQLLPLVYDELRSLAATYFRGEQPRHTLQPTALVHEAFVRLAAGSDGGWESRAHFLAVAARAMRHTLINHANAKKAAKRGGDAKRLSLSLDFAAPRQPVVDSIALEDALARLAELDRRKADVVEMRFYGGMTTEETAHVLGVSVSTVEADWRFSRAWLAADLSDE